MIEKAKNLLKKKHLLIVGKSEIERRQFINDLIIAVNFEVFRSPPKMKSIYDYRDFIKQEKLYEPWYKAKRYSVDQILDFHMDWIAENNSLVIMEEFEHMEESWRIELVRIYLNQIENRKKGEKKIHLVISQENENGLMEQLAKRIHLGDKERRTERQIIEQNLALIDLSA